MRGAAGEGIDTATDRDVSSKMGKMKAEPALGDHHSEEAFPAFAQAGKMRAESPLGNLLPGIRPTLPPDIGSASSSFLAPSRSSFSVVGRGLLERLP